MPDAFEGPKVSHCGRTELSCLAVLAQQGAASRSATAVARHRILLRVLNPKPRAGFPLLAVHLSDGKAKRTIQL